MSSTIGVTSITTLVMPGLFLFAPQIRCTWVSRASRPTAAAASRSTILIGSMSTRMATRSYAVVVRTRASLTRSPSSSWATCRRWNKRNNNTVSGEPKTRANQVFFSALCWVPLGVASRSFKASQRELETICVLLFGMVSGRAERGSVGLVSRKGRRNLKIVHSKILIKKLDRTARLHCR